MPTESRTLPPPDHDLRAQAAGVGSGSEPPRILRRLRSLREGPTTESGTRLRCTPSPQLGPLAQNGDVPIVPEEAIALLTRKLPDHAQALEDLHP